jgi:hypothetical protein
MPRPRIADEPTVVLHGIARRSHADVLDAYAKAEGISAAAALRRAVENFVSRPDVRAVAGLDDHERGAARSA